MPNSNCQNSSIFRPWQLKETNERSNFCIENHLFGNSPENHSKNSSSDFIDSKNLVFEYPDFNCKEAQIKLENVSKELASSDDVSRSPDSLNRTCEGRKLISNTKIYDLSPTKSGNFNQESEDFSLHSSSFNMSTQMKFSPAKSLENCRLKCNVRPPISPLSEVCCSPILRESTVSSTSNEDLNDKTFSIRDSKSAENKFSGKRKFYNGNSDEIVLNNSSQEYKTNKKLKTENSHEPQNSAFLHPNPIGFNHSIHFPKSFALNQSPPPILFQNNTSFSPLIPILEPPIFLPASEVERVCARRPRPKRFSCTECGAAFSNRGQLNGHARIHTGERPFKCSHPECGKKFTRNEELTRHRRIHSGLRPYGCSVCPKRFGRKDHLKKHLRTHTRHLIPQFPSFPPGLSPLEHFHLQNLQHLQHLQQFQRLSNMHFLPLDSKF